MLEGNTFGNNQRLGRGRRNYLYDSECYGDAKYTYGWFAE